MSDDARELKQTLLCGWRSDEGPPRIRVGLAHSELVVEVVPQIGDGPAIWCGPRLAPGARFAVEIGLHPGMGPGGILWRHTGSECWSSLESPSARGLESAVSPVQWAVGHGPGGPGDTPFRGRDLEVQRLATPMPEV